MSESSVILAGITLLPMFANAQQINEQRLKELSEKYALASLPVLKELLSIPNDAFYPDDIEKNVKWCEKAFQKKNFTTRRIATKFAPLLLAEREVKKAKKTVLVYLQVDGQPVDTSRWFQASPYKPVLKKQNSEGLWEEIPWELIEQYDDDWRVFARSTSDAKGPVAMFLAALDAIAEEKAFN